MSVVEGIKTKVKDSFVNFQARLGWGAGNVASGASYQFQYITRNRTSLEAMYRGSWIVGQIIDVMAEDMTRAGITLHSKGSPKDVETLNAGMRDLCIWQRTASTIKWARLFGGCIAVMLIDGQDVSTPLRLDSIKKDQFKGLLTLDRWLVNPDMTRLITTFGPDLGMPEFYQVNIGSQALAGKNIHHSRVLRFDGIELPFFQAQAEMFWSESVVERLYDRLVAFDSTTQGAAQLVYKAHLRTYKVPGLRDLISSGGKAFEALTQQIELIRLYQNNEGMTLMDAEDEFEAHQYTFTGLSDVLLQFGQQLSGATGIPLVRLFGQSPSGLNSTGESDLRTYYDGIRKLQESQMRRPFTILLDILHRSLLDKPAPEGFTFDFVGLWQLTEKEKAEIGKIHADTITAYVNGAVMDPAAALREVRELSAISGVGTNVTDEDIEEAENAPPPGEQALNEQRQQLEMQQEFEAGKPQEESENA